MAASDSLGEGEKDQEGEGRKGREEGKEVYRYTKLMREFYLVIRRAEENVPLTSTRAPFPPPPNHSGPYRTVPLGPQSREGAGSC